jgi:anti-sigma factor RsiW
MKPIDPAEVSALVDGELPPDRAKEVRLAIADDQSLHRVYRELLAMDADLKLAAAQAAFQPRVVLPGAAGNFGAGMFVAGVVLVLLRVVMKLTSPELAAGLATILLAAVIGWVAWFLLTSPTIAASRD